ncbi:MAG: hypothetical protein ABSH47_08960 [Bryobacteraceae bacterium]|jgi:hypothetical protein
MKLIIRRLLFGFAAVLLVVAWGESRAMAQEGAYSDARQLVQRVQQDLHHVMHRGTRTDKERERIEAAQKHLSDFDRNLSNNKFAKDRLDEAIDDVKNVADNNTLEARDRDALNADVNDLRQLREVRGNM